MQPSTASPGTRACQTHALHDRTAAWTAADDGCRFGWCSRGLGNAVTTRHSSLGPAHSSRSLRHTSERRSLSLNGSSSAMRSRASGERSSREGLDGLGILLQGVGGAVKGGAAAAAAAAAAGCWCCGAIRAHEYLCR